MATPQPKPFADRELLHTAKVLRVLRKIGADPERFEREYLAEPRAKPVPRAELLAEIHALRAREASRTRKRGRAY